MDFPPVCLGHMNITNRPRQEKKRSGRISSKIASRPAFLLPREVGLEAAECLDTRRSRLAKLILLKSFGNIQPERYRPRCKEEIMEAWQAILLSTGISAIAVFSTYLLSRWERISERKESKARWEGEVDSDRTWIKGAIDGIRSDISRIQDSIRKIFMYLPEDTGVDAPGSPRTLNELGKKISKEINAKQWAERLSRSKDLVLRIKDKSDYEVQEFSISYAVSELDPSESEMGVLHKCAYSNGLDISIVRRVLGIVLRDVLLRRRGTLE